MRIGLKNVYDSSDKTETLDSLKTDSDFHEENFERQGAKIGKSNFFTETETTYRIPEETEKFPLSKPFDTLRHTEYTNGKFYDNFIPQKQNPRRTVVT